MFELPGGGRVEPPSYFLDFLDPPNGVPDFVLGVSMYITRTIYIAVWKDSDSQKTQPLSYFPTIQTLVDTRLYWIPDLTI